MREHLEEFLIDTLLHQLVTCFNHNLQKETIPRIMSALTALLGQRDTIQTPALLLKSSSL